MKSTQNKSMTQINRKRYSIGHDDGNGGWGLKAWDISLEAALSHIGTRGDRILRFTKKGLKQTHSWRKNEWREKTC